MAPSFPCNFAISVFPPQMHFVLRWLVHCLCFQCLNTPAGVFSILNRKPHPCFPPESTIQAGKDKLIRKPALAPDQPVLRNVDLLSHKKWELSTWPSKIWRWLATPHQESVEKISEASSSEVSDDYSKGPYAPTLPTLSPQPLSVRGHSAFPIGVAFRMIHRGP